MDDANLEQIRALARERGLDVGLEVVDADSYPYGLIVEKGTPKEDVVGCENLEQLRGLVEGWGDEDAFLDPHGGTSMWESMGLLGDDARRVDPEQDE